MDPFPIPDLKPAKDDETRPPLPQDRTLGFPPQTTMSSPSPNIAVLVPTYNNDQTLRSVLEGAAASGLPVVVVDDASTDEGPKIIAELEAEGVVHASLRAPHNLGKAGAMKIGFTLCEKLGFSHAIICDSDEQHDTAMIRPFANAVRRQPDLYLLGCRYPLHPDQPRRNLIGRTLSNIAIRAHCGVAVGDSPCGFRCWPLEIPRTIGSVSGRYAWEEEMITRAAWAGWPIGSIDIPAIYHPRDTRVSHYRFRRDWTEGIAVYLLLLLEAIIPWPRRRHGPPMAGTLRRIRKLLLPDPIMGARPEARTESWFFTLSMAIALLVMLFAPIGAVSLAVSAWIGWRWHVGLPAIAVAITPSTTLLFGNPIGFLPLAAGVAIFVASIFRLGGARSPRREEPAAAVSPTPFEAVNHGSESPSDADAEPASSPNE